MRRFAVAIAALGAGLIMAGTPARARQPIQQVPTAPQLGPNFYAPFIWNGNPLDQKILDAQAQMLPPRHLIRPHRHYRHRG